MNGTDYTSDDISRCRTAAADALEAKGFQRVEFAGLYEPVYQRGETFVQLRRVLKTPRFELARVQRPEPMQPIQRAEWQPTPCADCALPVIRAWHAKRRAWIVLDECWIAGGVYQLAGGLAPNDSPCMVASVDRGRGYGHAEHRATCRQSMRHGRTA